MLKSSVLGSVLVSPPIADLPTSRKSCLLSRILALLVLLWAPALSFGQSPSGQIGPLRLPFAFKVTVSGILRSCSNSPEPDSSNGSFVIDWTIYPGDTNLHLRNDTITSSKKRGNIQSGASDTSLTLIFDTATRTIRTLRLAESFDINYGYPLGFTDYSSFVELTNLGYDSTSIFIPDSSLSKHLTDARYASNWLAVTGNGPTYCDTLARVSSIDLAGNFRPATLKSGVATYVTANPRMSYSNQNGIGRCTFVPADHLRILEIYTPLGTEASSVDIPSGSSEASLPLLSNGLYFVRLDQYLLKIVVN